ncbi:MAG: redoxin domain-containing protein [Phascolarctobacterium sp.]
MKKLLTSLLLAFSLVVVGGLTDNSVFTPANTLSSTTTSTSISKAEAAPQGVEVGQEAPDFTFTDLATGKPVKLSDLRDKPVFINFWATWCPPCVMELPHIQVKYEEYNEKMYFVAISVDDEHTAPVTFMRSKNYSFPAGYGDVNEISRLYQLQAIPASYIIDTNGIIKAKMIGSMNEAGLENFLQNAF